MSRWRRTILAAWGGATLVAFLLGLVDGAGFARSVGRIPHPVFPLAVGLVHAVFAAAVGWVVGAAAALFRRSTRFAAGFGAGAAFFLWIVSFLFLRFLPEAVEITSLPGIGVALLAIAASGFCGWLLHWPVARHGGELLLALLFGWVVVSAAGLLPAGIGAARGPLRPAPDAPGDGPSILLLVLDTFRADRLFRDDLTPHLNALAAEGTTFTRAISVSNHTPPPHASLLTGTYPATHGVQDQFRYFAGRNRTLAERLRDEGWVTFAVVANIQLQRFLGWDQGFDFYDDRLISLYGVLDWAERDPVLMLADRVGIRGQALLVGAAMGLGLFDVPTAEHVVDHTLDAVRRTGRAPFFGFVNFMDPHYPYDPPSVPPGERAAAREANRRLRAALGVPGHQFSDPDGARELVPTITRLYDAEVAYLDRQIGRLVEELEAAGRRRDTWIVVTADHGEHLGEHNRMLHANTVYRELVDVPLLVVPPKGEEGWGRGQRCEAIVSVVDIAPTVLELVGMEPDSSMEGRSLMPWLRASDGGWERDGSPRVVAAEGFGRRVVVWDHYRAVFEGDRLRHVFADGSNEVDDLLGVHPDLADSARSAEEAWRAAHARREGAEAEVRENMPVDQALERQLRALGYVE